MDCKHNTFDEEGTATALLPEDTEGPLPVSAASTTDLWKAYKPTASWCSMLAALWLEKNIFRESLTQRRKSHSCLHSRTFTEPDVYIRP